MPAKRTIIFWALFAGLLIVGQSVAAALARAVDLSAWQIASMVTWGLLALETCYGLRTWRQPPGIPGARLAALVVLGSIAVALVTGVRVYLGPSMTPGGSNFQLYPAAFGLAAGEHQGASIGLAGIWGMALAFVLGLRFIRLLVSPGHPVLGVARTLIDEAIRMKVALVFIVTLVVVVPILPFVLDPAERLQYRLQSLLTYSLTVSSLLLSLMTVFLACGTIAGELTQRQIFLTMTKPISRWQYLLGKWLGIVLLNLLLLAVTGGTTYVFAKMLERQPARDIADRMAVDEQVMVARASVRPTPPASMDVQSLFVKRFQQLYAEDPEAYGGAGQDLSKPEVLQKALENLTEAQRRAIKTAIVAKWHTIGPRDAQTFRFTGLAAAREFGPVVQLRMRAGSYPLPQDEMIHLGMRLNGQPYPSTPDGLQMPIVVAAGTYHVIMLPLMLADKDGNIEIEIKNENVLDPEQTFAASVSFDPGEGMEVLYRVGGFEANLLRALAVLWVRLGFLAVLGLTAATGLSFPVACLLSLMVYFGSTAKSFIVDSLGNYSIWAPANATLWEQIVWLGQRFFTGLVTGHIWDAMRLPIRLVGQTFVTLVPSFSEFDPVPLLADGRIVSPQLLGRALLWVGLVSAGACGVIGWFIFRRRELARVTV